MSLLKNNLVYILGLSFVLSVSACADDVMTDVEIAGEAGRVEAVKEFEAAVKAAELDIAEANAINNDIYYNHKKLKSLAMQGDVIAQRELGINYRYGYDVPEDPEEAASWIEKAAENGDAEAQYILASMYSLGTGVDYDIEKALEWNLRSANQGYADAQFDLAKDYLMGWSAAPQDATKSFEWGTRAALQGHLGAQNWVAMLYDKGFGTQQNRTMAKEWYGRACSKDEGYCKDYKRLEAEGY